MLGVSTCWKSSEAKNGKSLLDHLLMLGIDALELEYRIPSFMLKEMIPILKKMPIKIMSIHNFCPIPDIIPQNKASANVFLFSSGDKEERARAIKYSIKTIQLAHDLEVNAVILHVGHVDMDAKKELFTKLFKTGEIDSHTGRSFIKKQLLLRKEARQKNLDSVLFCLDKLNKEAEKLNVCIGVENRCHFHEIPDFEEIGIIIKEFMGGQVRYWHDVGHASLQEKFGILNHKKLLSTYAPDLLGMHIHDIKGDDDHRAPGTGDFNFSLIKKYLTPDTIKIVEVHPKVSKVDLLKGIEFLKSLGIE
ncbi:MAG: sugar phosphate isomerase/epimerase [Thermodesulfobacteriota bacterium]|nr:sugar phosphate isomerase/epimerase [Thermodesulfobacteriota bacterium]